jgi:hypothetical protein
VDISGDTESRRLFEVIVQVLRGIRGDGNDERVLGFELVVAGGDGPALSTAVTARAHGRERFSGFERRDLTTQEKDVADPTGVDCAGGRQINYHGASRINRWNSSQSPRWQRTA